MLYFYLQRGALHIVESGKMRWARWVRWEGSCSGLLLCIFIDILIMLYLILDLMFYSSLVLYGVISSFNNQPIIISP